MFPQHPIAATCCPVWMALESFPKLDPFGHSIQKFLDPDTSTSKCPDRDRGTDLSSSFAPRKPIYQLMTVGISPVQSSEEDDNPQVVEKWSQHISRFDSFEAKRTFREDTAFAKLHSLGISSAKNKVSSGLPLRGTVIATKRPRSSSRDKTEPLAKRSVDLEEFCEFKEIILSSNWKWQKFG